MTPEKTWIGIDVSQDLLDIHVLPQGLILQQSNNEAGIQVLIEQLLPLSPTMVVVESTGGLERLLVSSAVSQLNFRVDGSQLASRIIDLHLPINTPLDTVDIG
jgi:hypothetical protein